MAKFLHGDTDDRRLYAFTATIYDGHEEHVEDYQEGTLLELAEDWPIIRSLINQPNGELDHSMLEIPLEMELVIGWGHFKLELLNG